MNSSFMECVFWNILHAFCDVMDLPEAVQVWEPFCCHSSIPWFQDGLHRVKTDGTGKSWSPSLMGRHFLGSSKGRSSKVPNLLGQRPMRGSVLYLTLAVCVLLSLTSVKPPPQTLKQIHMPAPRSSWLAMGYANQRGRVLHVPGDRSAFLSCSGGGWRVQKHVTKAKICLVL